MIPIVDIAAHDLSDRVKEYIPDSMVVQTVTDILERVRDGGDVVLRELTRRFDGTELSTIEVGPELIQASSGLLTDVQRNAIDSAAENIRRFHNRQRTGGYEMRDGGMILGRMEAAVRSAGIYAPGGRATYPSSVLMGAIPATIAGVPDIFLCTPPGKDGSIQPGLLYAASIAGVKRVFRVGGAQAIAALAYGTETIPQVERIVGPGNSYVTEAKRQVRGRVPIDLLAGPSEVLVLSDGTSDPSWIAWDILSQAEHDPQAVCVALVPTEEYAGAVQDAIVQALEKSPRSQILVRSLDRSAIVIYGDIQEAIAFSERFAPEHLSIQLRDTEERVTSIGGAAYIREMGLTTAGSIFLGSRTPVALGDYASGTNHTLPTGGEARFHSGLSVDDFLRKPTFQCLTRPEVSIIPGTAAVMADLEGLHAHGMSITERGIVDGVGSDLDGESAIMGESAIVGKTGFEGRDEVTNEDMDVLPERNGDDAS